MREPEAAWSFPVSISDIPETGRHFDLAADAKTRAAVAALAAVPDVRNLRASFDVAPHGKGGVHVHGTVAATVVQTCVVTLDPLESEAEEEIDLTFAAQRGDQAPSNGSHDPADPDGPEPLVGNTVDLGAIASEYLVLGIDPYPRKPGVVFDAPQTPDDPADHPFAALAALKGRTPGRGT